MESRSTATSAGRISEKSPCQQIKELYREATSFTSSSPKAAIIQAAITAEAICKHIFFKATQSPPQENTLGPLVKLLKDKDKALKDDDNKLLPRHVEINIATIQERRNYAVHFQGHGSPPPNPRDAKIAIDSLSAVVDWFLPKYFPDEQHISNHPPGIPSERPADTTESASPELSSRPGNVGHPYAGDSLDGKQETTNGLHKGSLEINESQIGAKWPSSYILFASRLRERVTAYRVGLSTVFQTALEKLLRLMIAGILLVPVVLAAFWIVDLVQNASHEPPTMDLQVYLDPPEVVANGAEWVLRGNGHSWSKSGESVSLPKGPDLDIDFAPVPGYRQPPTQHLAWSQGRHALTFSYTKVVIATQVQSQVTVTLNPPEAASAGAGWKIDGPGEWKRSGDTIDLLIATDVYVIFKQIDGWFKPQRIHLDANRPKAISLKREYRRRLMASVLRPTPVSPNPTKSRADFGYLSVTIEARQAVEADVRWTIPGEPWRRSGAETGKLAPMPVAMSFSRVPGWTKPESQEVGIKAGSTPIVATDKPVDH